MAQVDAVGQSASARSHLPRWQATSLAVASVSCGLATGLWWVCRNGLPGDWEYDLGDRLLGPAAFLGPYLLVAMASAHRTLMPTAWWILAVTLGAVCVLCVATVANSPYREPYSGYLAFLLIGLQFLVAVIGLGVSRFQTRAARTPG